MFNSCVCGPAHLFLNNSWHLIDSLQIVSYRGTEVMTVLGSVEPVTLYATAQKQ